MILDTILTYAVAPGATGVAASVAPPGSLTLRPDYDPVIAYMLAMGQSTSFFARVTSPSGHDTTRGFTVGGGNTATSAQLKLWTPKVKRGETMSVTIGGSTTTGDLEMLAVSVAYPQAPGGRYITRAEVLRRAVQVLSLQGSLTPTTNGTWPAGTTLATFQDTLRANTEYALLGAEVGSAQDILGLMFTGPETAWGRVLIPVSEQKRELRQPTLMPEVAGWADMPLVPVFNSGNKSQLSVGLVANENGTARSTTIYLAQLG